MILKIGNVERIVTDEVVIAKMKNLGAIEVGEKQAGTPAVEPYKHANLEDLNVTQLKAIAKEKELKGYSSLGKEDLIELLKEGEENDRAGKAEDSDGGE